ncbi:hypothetical protein NQ314_018936 [Rhamnusium bicolor]|uniref:Uncharacterized protein n=1 Tax=Rhamnusium bicolor TaxID=1586634 RepID=A0AAV8WQU6_9CUCU|nr:hypothetical protein NQ314_018936 [Rhamnusium bicolor]
MKKLKDSKNLKDYDEVPLLLSSFCDGKDDYIALKDISFEGYGTFQRDKGVSQEYASLFLKLLANFHALSVAAKDQNPDFERAAKSLKWDELVEEYHKYLTQRIYELGSDRYLITLNDLKEDVQKNSLLGIAMAMESLVMSMLDDDEVADLDMLQSVWDISPFQDDLRNKKLAFLIKHAIDKGLII